LAFATFLVWWLRTGVGACGFWRYRMPPSCAKKKNIAATKVLFCRYIKIFFGHIAEASSHFREPKKLRKGLTRTLGQHGH